MDWFQVWRYANQIVSGATYDSLKKDNLIISEEDKKCFAEALSRPEYYSEQLPDAEIGVCSISDELYDYVMNGGPYPAGWAEEDEEDEEEFDNLDC